MEIVALTLSDVRLLAARHAEHGNSVLRMAGALKEARAGDALVRLRTLRNLERRFEVDLGALCDRWSRRDRPGTHPIERTVLDYVARWGQPTQPSVGDDRVLWVLVDRLRAVREWMTDPQLASEPDR